MAVQDYKINYKSDFVLTINGDAGWAIPFCIKFWTGMPSQAYFVGFDGVKYVNCRVGDTPTQLLVMFDGHHLPIGPLRMQIAYHTTIEEFPGSVFDEVTNARDVIVNIDGTDYQVLLDFTGEDAPELEFNLPAYANEAERIQNELQRQQNEAARIAAELQREQATAAAVQGAENVNAQLNGTTLTVTNRQGVSTSVNTKGEQGEQGPVGPEGPQGEQGVSIVSFLPKSETSTTLIYTITYSNGYTQDVAIPKGPKGDTGATGPTGPQGPQGDTGVSITGFIETGETETATLYNITFSNGTTQAVAIPKGEKGDQGPVGPQGPQGPMGDVAVITPEQQAAFTMYSTTGQNTNGPMTQKATTDSIINGNSMNDNEILNGIRISFIQGLFNSSGQVVDFQSALVTTSLVQGGQFISVKDGYCIRRVGKCNATTGTFIEMYAADNFTRRVLYLEAGYSYIVGVAHQDDTVISPSEDVLYTIYPYGYKTINTTDNPDEFINGKASTIGFLPSDTDKSFFHRIDYEGQVFYGQYWNTAGNIRGLWICDNNQGENAVRISSGTTAGWHNEFYQATASDVGKYICISSEIGTGKVMKCAYYNMWHPLDSASVSNDFCIQDKNGNSIIQVNGGYIKTQNFDSSTFDYKELYGKKVVFLGDSITEASYGYHQRFAALTGCIVVNLGVSGSSIAARPAPYADVRFETRATAENLAGASLIVVFGGTNDFDGDVYPIGELFSYIEDTPQYRYGGKTIVAPSDTQAFGGAVHQLINKIRTNAPGVPIMFITPLDRYFEATTPADRRPMSNEYNNHMDTMQDYRNAIDAICQFYGIPVFHAEHIPQLEPGDATFAEEYFLDKLHPNVQGHIVLGTCLYKWVKNNLYFK